MQTSLARRQRHRRALQGRPKGRRGSIIGRVAVVVLIVFLSTTLLATGAGLVVAVGAYNHYAANLPDPAEALQNLEFDQQTRVVDRTGKIELAKLGSLRREVVTYDQIPGEMIDATTSIEDQDFWQNPGFDPVGIVSAGVDTISGRPRGASTITQQLVRARLLPDWAFEGSTYERKFREIIQSVRLTQEYPGQSGKEQILTAYLNQNFYGNNSYGVKAAARGYFGKALQRPDDRPVRDPRGDPAVADQVRPREELGGGLQDDRRGRRRLPGVRPDRPRHGRDRGATEPRAGPDEDPQHADGRRSTRSPSTKPPSWSRSC